MILIGNSLISNSFIPINNSLIINYHSYHHHKTDYTYYYHNHCWCKVPESTVFHITSLTLPWITWYIQSHHQWYHSHVIILTSTDGSNRYWYNTSYGWEYTCYCLWWCNMTSYNGSHDFLTCPVMMAPTYDCPRIPPNPTIQYFAT